MHTIRLETTMTLRPTATKSLVLTVILLAATTAARGQTATGIRDDANFFSPQGEAKAADAINAALAGEPKP